MINAIKQHLLNLPGWHTRRKIVVIQSDDWGSIRMPTEKVRQQLDQHPMIDASDGYCRFDTLASAEDLEALFEVLTSVKDRNGNPAVLTANCLVANPDFEAIRASNFQSYHYETLDKTFERYHNEKALSVWKEGIDQGIFIPQFHGREHVNVPFWMHQLQQGHEGVRKAFDYGVFGVNFKDLPYRKPNFQAAWDFDTSDQEEQINQSIQEGMQLFEARFGFRSATAIAPSYTWSHKQEKLLIELGVKQLQSIAKQKTPRNNEKKFNSQYRLYGKKRRNIQLRNVFFEPSIQPSVDHLGNAMSRIAIAFNMRKPVIIGSHRLNFIGSLQEQNRLNNLKCFKQLLRQIVKTWPEVEFCSAAALANIIKN